LGWLGDQTDAPTLARFARNPNPMTRRVAVEALGRVGGEGAREPLWAGLQDEAWEVRAESALGLGALPPSCGPGSLQAIERALATEPEPFVRERLLRALPELGDPARGAALLLGVPLGGDWRALRAAARGLGELRAAQAQAWLRGLLDHPCYDVAEQASWALGRLDL
jgi:HEAT repeat protein